MNFDPNIAILILIGGFLVMIAIKVPVAFALALSSAVCAAYVGLPLMVIPQNMVKGVNSFSLLAIPFFILAGEIMGEGGISDRLIKFADVLIGRMRGGLAMVNILASMFFGGISGSAVADTSSIGAMMIPMMEKKGYDKDFSINVTITSACQGILIPPSHNMIMYASVAGGIVGGISVEKLFMAGLFPGIFLGIALMVLSYIIAVKRSYPRSEKYALKDAAKICVDSFLGLMTAVIIMGGVLFGIFTATESAAFACIWAFIVTFFIYRDIPISRMVLILKKTLKTLAIVMSVIAASSAFGYMMAFLRIPDMATSALLSISSNKIVLLLLINVLLLALGCIMDMAPLILITTPILLPVVTAVGMDPIQFGIVMMLNLSIGLLTPPVGTVLFVGCSIGGAKVEDVMKGLMPFYITMFIVLMVLTFWPPMSLWLPAMKTVLFG